MITDWSGVKNTDTGPRGCQREGALGLIRRQTDRRLPSVMITDKPGSRVQGVGTCQLASLYPSSYPVPSGPVFLLCHKKLQRATHFWILYTISSKQCTLRLSSPQQIFPSRRFFQRVLCIIPHCILHSFEHIFFLHFYPIFVVFVLFLTV